MPTARSGPWWTGGSKKQPVDVVYKWLSGGSISNNDARWAIKPLTADESHCVRLLSPGVMNGGKWIDDACTDPLPFICEQVLP